MAITQYVTVGPLVASSANNIVTSVTPTSGTALTLTAGVIAKTIPDKPRRILVTFGNEASNRTIVLVGTNYWDQAITETLAIASGAGSTIGSVYDYKTITSITPLGGGWTAAATVGTSGIASSPWQMINKHISPINLELWATVTGTINYTIEYTPDDPSNVGPFGNAPATPAVFSGPSGVTTKTGTADGQITWPIAAWRVTVNSNTNPATVTAGGLQAGIAGN